MPPINRWILLGVGAFVIVVLVVKSFSSQPSGPQQAEPPRPPVAAQSVVVPPGIGDLLAGSPTLGPTPGPEANWVEVARLSGSEESAGSTSFELSGGTVRLRYSKSTDDPTILTAALLADAPGREPGIALPEMLLQKSGELMLSRPAGRYYLNVQNAALGASGATWEITVEEEQ